MMKLSPKQAEIRSREAKILHLARPMVARSGLMGLSMDSIAKKMRYAKGTIYNHFGCKEEILLALAIQALETRLALFRSAAGSQQRSRDRMAAIGVACEEFRIRFDDLFRIETMVRHATIWEKASEERRELMMHCESSCMELVAGVARDAVHHGDLPLSASQRPEDLVFGLWSLTYGGMLIDSSSPGLNRVGIRDTFTAIRRNCNAMMDGYGWEPLYEPRSYGRLVRRAQKLLRDEVPEAVTVGSEAPVIE